MAVSVNLAASTQGDRATTLKAGRVLSASLAITIAFAGVRGGYRQGYRQTGRPPSHHVT